MVPLPCSNIPRVSNLSEKLREYRHANHKEKNRDKIPWQLLVVDFR